MKLKYVLRNRALKMCMVNLAEGRNQWRALVKAVMNLDDSIKKGGSGTS